MDNGLPKFTAYPSPAENKVETLVAVRLVLDGLNAAVTVPFGMVKTAPPVNVTVNPSKLKPVKLFTRALKLIVEVASSRKVKKSSVARVNTPKFTSNDWAEPEPKESTEFSADAAAKLEPRYCTAYEGAAVSVATAMATPDKRD